MKTNKILKSVIMSAVIAVLTVLFSVSSFAAEPGTKDNPWDAGAKSGTVTAYVENETLYITGTGETKSYASNSIPWLGMNDSIKKAVVSEGITSLSGCTFTGLTKLYEVSLPSTLKVIGAFSFNACSALKTVDFPNGLETIGSYAFESSAIENAILPDTVKSVSSEAFRNCRSLKKIKLSKAMTSVAKKTFAGCTAVSEIHIPVSVTSIGYGVFHEFGASVIDVYYGGSPEQFKGIDMVYLYHEPYGATYYNDCIDKANFHYNLSTKEDILYFLGSIANGNSHQKNEFTLTNNISLGGIELSDIWSDSNREKQFKGHFNGSGYTISDFTLNANSYRGGFFRTLGSGAVVENLTLENGNVFGKDGFSAFGILVGIADGNITLKNNRVLGGSVDGYANVGGLIGEIKSGSATISDCFNYATVNSRTKNAGGILGCVNSSKSVSLINCRNYGEISAANGNAGGISAYLGNNSDDQAHTVSGCENTAYVICASGRAGGIIGGLCTDNCNHSVSHNKNYGDVKGSKETGGIIGFLEGGGNVVGNANEGNVSSDSSHAGGIVGGIEDDSCLFGECTNKGNITAAIRCGGIVGYAGDNDLDRKHTFAECENSGKISGGTDAGGIVGGLCTDSRSHIVSDCVNSGEITGTACVGGIIGWMEGGGTFSGLLNKGDAVCTASNGYVGGIVGRIEDDPVTFTDCKNEGKVTGGGHNANICGYDGKNKRAISSVFGSGNITYIIIFAVVTILAVCAVFFVYKKKDSKKS